MKKKTNKQPINKENEDSKKYHKKGYHIQRIKPTDQEHEKGQKI